MSKKVLLIFEGEWTEEQYFQSMNRFFLENIEFVICVFEANIYQLFDSIRDDEFIDTFSLLRENEVTEKYIRDWKRSDFAEIYLIFDFDGHDPHATKYGLLALLELFDNESEHGKLYLSYPMIEAHRHLSFENHCGLFVRISDLTDYKKVVHYESNIRNSVSTWSYNLWKTVIELHLRKANNVVNNVCDFPVALINQLEILEAQYDRHIETSQEVGVIGSIPLLILDYYGVEKSQRIFRTR